MNKLSIAIVFLIWLSGLQPNAFVIPRHQVEINIDGKAKEAIWSKAKSFDKFLSPWDSLQVPPTSFKSFCDSNYLYFFFKVRDAQVICYDNKDNSKAVEGSDRVEIFFASNDSLSTYFGIEIDACARFISFRADGYRQFVDDWTFPKFGTEDFEIKASRKGYAVEGRIDLKILEELDILHNGSMLIGVHRAEYLRNRSEEQVRWLSWNSFEISQPDFHVREGFRMVQIK